MYPAGRGHEGGWEWGDKQTPWQQRPLSQLAAILSSKVEEMKQRSESMPSLKERSVINSISPCYGLWGWPRSGLYVVWGAGQGELAPACVPWLICRLCTQRPLQDAAWQTPCSLRLTWVEHRAGNRLEIYPFKPWQMYRANALSWCCARAASYAGAISGVFADTNSGMERECGWQ